MVDGKVRTGTQNGCGSGGKMAVFIRKAHLLSLSLLSLSLGETQVQQDYEAGVDRGVKSCGGTWFYLNSRGRQVAVLPPAGESSRRFLDSPSKWEGGEVTGKNHR